MTFTEIKPKIKNLGKYKTLEQIKRDGLRIVKNSKTGAYWLIEKEFLKPVIKSPRECKSIIVNPKDLKFNVLMVHKDRKELKSSKVLKYIKWGENRGFNKRPTCSSRNIWWNLSEINSPILSKRFIDTNFNLFINPQNTFIGDTFFCITPDKKENSKLLGIILNSSLYAFFIEIYGRAMMGEGVLLIYGPEISPLPSIEFSKIAKSCREKIKKVFDKLSNRSTGTIFQELGAKNSKDVSLDKVKPDRRELDKIVMGEILGLTDKEQLEVYRAVIDLVKSRIDKAKSFGKKKKTKTGIDIDALVKIVLDKIGDNTLRKFYKEKVLNQKDLITKKLPELKDKIEIKKGLFGWQIVSGKSSIDCRSEDEAQYLKIWFEVDAKSIKIPKDEKYLIKITKEFKKIKSDLDKIIENYLGSILDQKIKNQILHQIWQKII